LTALYPVPRFLSRNPPFFSCSIFSGHRRQRPFPASRSSPFFFEGLLGLFRVAGLRFLLFAVLFLFHRAVLFFCHSLQPPKVPVFFLTSGNGRSFPPCYSKFHLFVLVCRLERFWVRILPEPLFLILAEVSFPPPGYFQSSLG